MTAATVDENSPPRSRPRSAAHAAEDAGAQQVGVQAVSRTAPPPGTAPPPRISPPVRVPLHRRALVGQLLRFGVVGAASTVAYLALFAALATSFGAQAANFLALLVTAIANTALNRRWTFGIRGSDRVGRTQLEGLTVFGLGLALTSGSLALLHAGHAHPGRPSELAVLVAANLTATVLRFVLLRNWVFDRRRGDRWPQE